MFQPLMFFSELNQIIMNISRYIRSSRVQSDFYFIFWMLIGSTNYRHLCDITSSQNHIGIFGEDKKGTSQQNRNFKIIFHPQNIKFRHFDRFESNPCQIFFKSIDILKQINMEDNTYNKRSRVVYGLMNINSLKIGVMIQIRILTKINDKKDGLYYLKIMLYNSLYYIKQKVNRIMISSQSPGLPGPASESPEAQRTTKPQQKQNNDHKPSKQKTQPKHSRKPRPSFDYYYSKWHQKYQCQHRNKRQRVLTEPRQHQQIIKIDKLPQIKSKISLDSQQQNTIKKLYEKKILLKKKLTQITKEISKAKLSIMYDHYRQQLDPEKIQSSIFDLSPSKMSQKYVEAHITKSRSHVYKKSKYQRIERRGQSPQLVQSLQKSRQVLAFIRRMHTETLIRDLNRIERSKRSFVKNQLQPLNLQCSRSKCQVDVVEGILQQSRMK